MVFTMRQVTLALLGAGLALAGNAAAQVYPNRSTRIIIPFAAGGATDVVFRMLTPALSEQLGQQVVIDNRPGGAATIGMDLTAKAAPDGYAMGVASVAFGVNPFALRKLPYDTENKGGGPSVISSVSRETAINFTSVPASVQHLRSAQADRPRREFAHARPGASRCAEHCRGWRCGV